MKKRTNIVTGFIKRITCNAKVAVISKDSGMELVQVAILIAIAIVVGLIFRHQIEDFVEEVFSNLSSKNFL